MADYRLIIPFVLSQEGGLSKNPQDDAAKTPVPDGSGYHTNKGVTWATFKSTAPALGYPVTAELFYKMPQDLWGKIFKKFYWDRVKGDQIKTQAVANQMADFLWGSGRAILVIQKMLRDQFKKKIAVDGAVGPQTVAAINSIPDQQALFYAITEARKNYMKSLADYNTFGRGWMRRVEGLYKAWVNTIPVAATIGIGTVGVGVGVFFWSDTLSSLQNLKINPMETLLSPVFEYLDPVYCLCLLCFTELLKRLLSSNQVYISYTPREKRRFHLYLSLWMGLLIGSIYYQIKIRYLDTPVEVVDFSMRMAASYGFATSFYRFIVKYIISLLQPYENDEQNPVD